MIMSSIAVAQAIDPLPFRDHAEELRFQHLTSELRCLVCQDETSPTPTPTSRATCATRCSN
jgi:cytochrome c-type biogenesis protein CcmH/NrfF